MRNLSSRVLLLTLALVLGQWLSIAHASSHAYLSADDVECDFCVHAQGLSAGAYQLPKAAAPEIAHERPQTLVACVFQASAPSFYAIRGPPRRLAN